MKTNKCDCCGKFRKEEDLVFMQAEYDEQWLECRFCMSSSDKERFYKEEENDL